MTTLCQTAESASECDGIDQIRVDGPVGLIAGAPVDSSIVAEIAARVTSWVAADGGADHALAAELPVHAVIGDMDSISPAVRAAYADKIHQIDEQMTTDFDKALRHVHAPLVLALGVSGGRMDHALAALTVLARHPDRPCVIVGTDSVVALCPPMLTLDLPVGAPVSIYPLAPVSVGSTGLKWPTKGLTLSPVDLVGTSNEATGPVTLQPEAPTALVILARAQIDALIEGLLGAGRWSAVGDVYGQPTQ